MSDKYSVYSGASMTQSLHDTDSMSAATVWILENGIPGVQYVVKKEVMVPRMQAVLQMKREA